MSVVAAVVAASSVPLARFWMARGRIDVYFDWSPGAPISQNLLCYEWGDEQSTIIDPDDGRPGYVGTALREWCIGPLLVTRVIYSRP